MTLIKLISASATLFIEIAGPPVLFTELVPVTDTMLSLLAWKPVAPPVVVIFRLLKIDSPVLFSRDTPANAAPPASEIVMSSNIWFPELLFIEIPFSRLVMLAFTTFTLPAALLTRIPRPLAELLCGPIGRLTEPLVVPFTLRRYPAVLSIVPKY